MVDSAEINQLSVAVDSRTLNKKRFDNGGLFDSGPKQQGSVVYMAKIRKNFMHTAPSSLVRGRAHLIVTKYSSNACFLHPRVDKMCFY